MKQKGLKLQLLVYHKKEVDLWEPIKYHSVKGYRYWGEVLRPTALPHPLLISLVHHCVCAITHTKADLHTHLIMPVKSFCAFKE